MKCAVKCPKCESYVAVEANDYELGKVGKVKCYYCGATVYIIRDMLGVSAWDRLASNVKAEHD